MEIGFLFLVLQEMIIEDDIFLQTEQCLKNIISTLEKSESNIKDVVRVPYILPDASDFEKY